MNEKTNENGDAEFIGEKEDLMWMKEAVKQAKLALEMGNYGIGAVVVLNGKIISTSGNEVVTRGIKPYAHAENLVLDKLKDSEHDSIGNYRNMKIYTTLAPCPMCWGKMIMYGIKEVVYGSSDVEGAQDFETSIPEVHKKTAPAIRQINNDIKDECYKLFYDTREKIDEVFFK